MLLLNRDHICTFATRGVGVCTFDSGSPVVANGEVVGVVAFVVGCAMGFPVSIEFFKGENSLTISLWSSP